MDCWGATYDVDDWDILTESDDSFDITDITDKFKNLETLKQEWILADRKKNIDINTQQVVLLRNKNAKKQFKKKQKKRSKKVA